MTKRKKEIAAFTLKDLRSALDKDAKANRERDAIVNRVFQLAYRLENGGRVFRPALIQRDGREIISVIDEEGNEAKGAPEAARVFSQWLGELLIDMIRGRSDEQTRQYVSPRFKPADPFDGPLTQRCFDGSRTHKFDKHGWCPGCGLREAAAK